MNQVYAVAFACIAFIFIMSSASAEEPYRIVVLPFKEIDTRPGLGIGLATGLQRSLNAIDGVYAPALGDAVVFLQRTLESNLNPTETISTAFAAHAIISGIITQVDNDLRIVLGVAGLQFTKPLEFQLETNATNPSGTLSALLNKTIDSLDLKPSFGDRRDAQRSADQAPAFQAFRQVGFATARLGTGSLEKLEDVVTDNPHSSWVLAEYARALTLEGLHVRATEVAISATEKLPTDVEAWVIRGITHVAAQEIRQATFAFTEALRLNPNHALALVGLAHISKETPGPAADAYLAAISSNPRLLEAYLGLANLQEDPRRAIQVLLSATDHLPDSAALHRQIVDRAITLGDTPGALAYLKQVVTNPLAAFPSTFALVSLLTLPETGPLVDFLATGINRFPNDPVLLEAAAALELRNGNPQLAETHVRRALASVPGNPGLVNKLAIALAQQGKIDDAIEAFRAVSGKDSRGQLNLAKTFLEAGQPRAALDALNQYTALDQDANALALYGIALARIGHFQRAEMALTRALVLDPNTTIASQALSLLQQQRSITDGMVVELSGEAAVHFHRGMFALEQRRWVDAAAAFAVAAKVQPSPLVSFYEGYSLQLSGRNSEALQAYALAAKSFSESDIVLNNLGYAYLQIGRYDLALEHLSGAFRLNPSNSSVLLNLGLTQFGLGLYAEALGSWDQAESLNPTLGERLNTLRAEAQERVSP